MDYIVKAESIQEKRAICIDTGIAQNKCLFVSDNAFRKAVEANKVPDCMTFLKIKESQLIGNWSDAHKDHLLRRGILID